MRYLGDTPTCLNTTVNTAVKATMASATAAPDPVLVSDMDGEARLASALECLALERDAERLECDAIADTLSAAEQARRGLALHRLRVEAVETALFGRVMITMHLPGGRALPQSKLSTGAMVGRVCLVWGAHGHAHAHVCTICTWHMTCTGVLGR